jgi:hypothetical protein
MRVTCDQCERVLDFSGDRPSYCAYCGQPIPPRPPLAQTDAYDEANTPSDVVSLASTQVPHEQAFPETPPDRIGEYRITRRLGSGGMGTVYEAEDEHSGRRVAVKVIKPQMAASDGAIERFRQEGRLASLIAHPRCDFVLKADEDAGRPYIVMELMPGATLKDLVEQQGPLSPSHAVSKVLDVLDGLGEAHQLGVIHRDVKPSNCFVLPDGHVKIGDFGLAKSLQQQGHITRTGAFLGTPLFASPEQIKGEPIDARTDVYSVAATLYYLLTGKAPFEGGDPTATVARIVSESAPSVRLHRPRVPPKLEQVVMRGLERQREKRWHDLDEFRQALLPFVPGYYQYAGRRARLRALAADGVLLLPPLLLLLQLTAVFWKPGWLGLPVGVVQDLLGGLLIFGYFMLTEWKLGATVGKGLLRLRVTSITLGHEPTLRQSALRTLCFMAVVLLPGKIVSYVMEGVAPESPVRFWVELAGYAAGVLLLADTTRRGVGYRTLHDLVSGTRVVQLPWPKRRSYFTADGRGATDPASDTLPPVPLGVPDAIGPFRLRGLVQATPDEMILAADDTMLGRKAWVVLQPAALHTITPDRREVTRSTRLRWLTGGTFTVSTNLFPSAARSSARREHEVVWDAFLAATGRPLPTILREQGRLPWADARPILEQLADELTAGCADDTIPAAFAPEQVWLQPNGRLLFIASSEPSEETVTPADRQRRCIEYLRQIAILLLEGRPRPPAAPPRPARAPVPRHDRPIIDRLVVGNPPFQSPAEVHRSLVAQRDHPLEVNTALRLTHLLVMGALLAPVLLAMFAIVRVYYEIAPTSALMDHVRRAERVLAWLDEPEAQRGLGAVHRPHPDLSTALLDLLVERTRVNPDAVRDRIAAGELKQIITDQVERDRKELETLKRSLIRLPLRPLFEGLVFVRERHDETARLNVTEDQRLEVQRMRDLNHALAHAYGDAAHPRRRGRGVFAVPLDELGSSTRTSSFGIAWSAILAGPLVWTLWAALTSGGLLLGVLGLELVRADGRRAAWWQCAWRSALVWFPIVLLLGLSMTVQHVAPRMSWVHWGLWWLAAMTIAVYIVLALVYPTRCAHDRLSGVYVLPK